LAVALTWKTCPILFNINNLKKPLADYAHSKGIDLGDIPYYPADGFSEEVDVINPRNREKRWCNSVQLPLA